MQQLTEIEDRIAKCKKILADNPNSTIFAALAEAYRKKGDLERASLICQKGLEIHPDYGPAHLVMSKIDLDRKLYDEAEKELDIAARLDGRTRAVEVILSEILVKKGKYQEAENILSKLISSEPRNESLKMLLGSIRRTSPVKTTRPERETFSKPVFDSRPKPSHPAVVQDSQLPSTFPKLKAEKIYSVNEVMEILGAFPAVVGVLSVGKDGLILDDRLKSGINPDIVAAVATNISEVTKASLIKIDFGKLKQVLIEAHSLKFWIFNLKNSFLVLVCSAEVNIGSLKMKTSELLEILEE
ncbi:MAG: TPR protein [candidate division Zixibacteria bacterium RBG-1]|nr:MAG: TPR protein [candidate division Zixibacteria bacterium RBG-1]OGC85351.1 MAG: hypothetical protein A2V73_09040 [candidate division Zixibacteria bacterium RBG_19FT_COMBO_42_43]